MRSRIALPVIFAVLVIAYPAALRRNPRGPMPKTEVVAGSDSDLMIVRHVVVRGTEEEIGEQLADLAKQNHETKPQTLDADTYGKRMDWFKKDYPEVMKRAGGVRKAYPDLKDPLTDFTSLPYDMNVAPGCSVIYYPPKAVSDSHAMLSRNYDFPKAKYAELTGRRAPVGARSFTGDPYVIEMYPSDGLASLYTCSYDLLQGVIDGVNEKGVTVALLADDMSKKHTRGTPDVGLGEIDLPRFILDRAKSAKQARELLKDVPYYATFTACHYIIGDSTGDSFVFEVDPNDQHHVIDGGGKPQIVTNHSLFEYGAENLPSGNSFDRFRRLQAELAKRKGKLTPTEVKEINYCVAVPDQVKVAATLWHAVYDLTDRSVQISFCLSGSDEDKQRRSPYLSFQLTK